MAGLRTATACLMAAHEFAVSKVDEPAVPLRHICNGVEKRVSPDWSAIGKLASKSTVLEPSSEGGIFHDTRQPQARSSHARKSDARSAPAQDVAREKLLGILSRHFPAGRRPPLSPVV